MSERPKRRPRAVAVLSLCTVLVVGLAFAASWPSLSAYWSAHRLAQIENEDDWRAKLDALADGRVVRVLPLVAQSVLDGPRAPVPPQFDMACAVEPAVVADRWPRLVYFDALMRERKFGPGAVAALGRLSRDGRSQVRAWAARWLGDVARADADSAHAIVLAMIGDDDLVVRECAARALGKLSRSPLSRIEILGDRLARAKTVEEATAFADVLAVVVTEVVREDSLERLEAALRAFGMGREIARGDLVGPVVDALVRSNPTPGLEFNLRTRWTDHSTHVERSIDRVAALWADEEARWLRASSREVRNAALTVFNTRGVRSGDAIELVSPFLVDPDPAVRRQAVEWIGQQDETDRVLRVLRRELESDDSGRSAAAAIAIATYIQFGNDDSPGRGFYSSASEEDSRALVRAIAAALGDLAGHSAHEHLIGALEWFGDESGPAAGALRAIAEGEDEFLADRARHVLRALGVP